MIYIKQKKIIDVTVLDRWPMVQSDKRNGEDVRGDCRNFRENVRMGQRYERLGRTKNKRTDYYTLIDTEF